MLAENTRAISTQERREQMFKEWNKMEQMEQMELIMYMSLLTKTIKKPLKG